MAEPEMIRLFSYGTLQQENVQMATFGRRLAGKADAMPGYRTDFLEITNPEVIRHSGKRFHPIVRRTGASSDVVEGTVFFVTADELAAADHYEVSDYQRIEVTLRSGLNAWVYVSS